MVWWTNVCKITNIHCIKKNEYHSICNTHTLQSFSTKYTTSNIRHRTIFTNVIKTSEKNIPSLPYISGSLLVFPLFIFSVNIYVDPQCFSHHIFAYMYDTIHLYSCDSFSFEHLFIQTNVKKNWIQQQQWKQYFWNVCYNGITYVSKHHHAILLLFLCVCLLLVYIA